MNEFDIDKAYVSPYDKFLAKFDHEHAPSASQLKEIATYQRIFALRDELNEPSEHSDQLESFLK